MGNTSKPVREWRRSADAELMRRSRPLPTVWGLVGVRIRWSSYYAGKRDVDNQVKPLLDYLQSRGLIVNDRDIRELVVGFADMDPGWCSVAIYPWRPE